MEQGSKQGFAFPNVCGHLLRLAVSATYRTSSNFQLCSLRSAVRKLCPVRPFHAMAAPDARISALRRCPLSFRFVTLRVVAKFRIGALCDVVCMHAYITRIAHTVVLKKAPTFSATVQRRKDPAIMPGLSGYSVRNGSDGSMGYLISYAPISIRPPATRALPK